MSFLDEVRAETPARGPMCSVSILMQALGSKEQAELDDALASDLPATAIERAARKRNWNIRAEAIRRHRQRACLCPF